MQVPAKQAGTCLNRANTQAIKGAPDATGYCQGCPRVLHGVSATGGIFRRLPPGGGGGHQGGRAIQGGGFPSMGELTC